MSDKRRQGPLLLLITYHSSLITVLGMDIKFYKLLLFVNALVPVVLVGWDWRGGRLGANPLDFVTRTTGTLTLVFLVLTLAVTPLRRLTGANWLVRLRRMAGLYAFFYGALHLLAYVWFDKWFDAAAV